MSKQWMAKTEQIIRQMANDWWMLNKDLPWSSAPCLFHSEPLSASWQWLHSTVTSSDNNIIIHATTASTLTYILCVNIKVKGKQSHTGYDGRTRADLYLLVSWPRGDIVINTQKCDRLPLLSARSKVTFPATEHLRPLALYYFETKAYLCMTYTSATFEEVKPTLT